MSPGIGGTCSYVCIISRETGEKKGQLSSIMQSVNFFGNDKHIFTLISLIIYSDRPLLGHRGNDNLPLDELLSEVKGSKTVDSEQSINSGQICITPTCTCRDRHAYIYPYLYL
jgi:hypothetical protein